MKKNIAIVLSVLALVLIGCEKNVPYEPGKPATTKQVFYFPVTGELGLELDPDAGITSHDFVIARRDSSKAESLALVVTANTDNVFKIPAKVDFEANVGTKTVTVEFISDKMSIGNTYKFAVHADWDAMDPYAVDTTAAGKSTFPTYEYETTVIKYEKGTGVFVDDPVLALIGLPSGVAWTAEYKLANLPSGERKLIIINPYTTPATGVDPEAGVYIGCPFTTAGLEVDDSKDYNFFFMIDADGYVTHDDFDLGQIYPGVGMCSIVNYKGNTSYGYIDDDAQVVVFDQADSDNNSVFYAGPYAQNYVGFYFYLSVEAYVADQEEPAAEAPARAPKFDNVVLSPVTAKVPVK